MRYFCKQRINILKKTSYRGTRGQKHSGCDECKKDRAETRHWRQKRNVRSRREFRNSRVDTSESLENWNKRIGGRERTGMTGQEKEDDMCLFVYSFKIKASAFKKKKNCNSCMKCARRKKRWQKERPVINDRNRQKRGGTIMYQFVILNFKLFRDTN